MGKINEVQKLETLNGDDVIAVITSSGVLSRIEHKVLANLFSTISKNMSERVLIKNTDLNDIVKSGVYYQSLTEIINSLINKPTGPLSGEMSMLVIGGDDRFLTQLYFDPTRTKVFIRFKSAVGWSVWSQLSFV